MCGRYFFSENIDLSKYLKILNRKYEQLTLDLFSGGDIKPTDVGLTLDINDYDLKRWGYKLNNRQLINARIESIMEKQYYTNDYQTNKCVILASGFYEWDSNKQKNIITTNDEIIYLAGIFQKGDNLDNFSIITKPATTTASIHNRIPIVLDYDQALGFINNEMSFEQLLNNKPDLKVSKEFENISLF